MKEQSPFTLKDSCRICKTHITTPFLSFGSLPLAGGFIKPDEIGKDISIPLTIAFCPNCKEVQTLETVSADFLFRDYRFLASSTATLSDHFQEYATVMKRRFLNPGSLVVELGSNDGVLLKPFMDLGIKAVGFEPAVNIAQVAVERGCEVINDFFNTQTVSQVITKHGKADLICANNVFAHIDDMHEIMRTIDMLLEGRGVFVFEVHYLLDLIKSYQYDMMYHEHLMHHSLAPLAHLLGLFDMEIFDVERISIHSGSIRVFSQRKKTKPYEVSHFVQQLVELEKANGLYDFKTFEKFGAEVLQKRDDLRDLIAKIVSQGKRVVGYGASGRATMHLNFSSLGTDLIEYVVDSSPERFGRLVPGTRNPIKSPEHFREDKPDYAVVFAYNYLEEISSKEREFLQNGGKFIVPLPVPQIIST